jgi:uncharacterized protein (DUF2141 family)
MKILILCLFVLTACGAPPSKGLAPTIKLEPGTSTLRVEIAGIRNTKGTIGCSLFNAGEGFPGASPIIDGDRQAGANGGTLQFEVPALPAGTYAVVMQHDENDNGELDTSFVGAPTEGYGVTNNITHATSGPTWDESKFELAADQVLEQRINVKY